MGRVAGASAGRELSFEEFMELVGGPVGESEFASDQDREATWHRHREQLMERRGSRAGDRPWGYWVYEVGGLVDAGRLEQVLLLQDRGELSEEERRELSAAAEHARNGRPLPKRHHSRVGGAGYGASRGTP